MTSNAVRWIIFCANIEADLAREKVAMDNEVRDFCGW
jgi:hypothetical protein